MTKDDVLRKVRALLAMTENRGATEAEAAVASAKAQALLMEYNLSLPSSDGGSDCSEPMAKHLERYTPNKFTGDWMAALAGSIAKHNLCTCVLARADGNGVWILGSETNVRIVSDLWQYLVQQTRMACMAAYQDAWREETPAKFAKSFYWGAVSRLQERLRESARQAQTVKPESYGGTEAEYRSACTALVVRNQQDLSTWVRECFPGGLSSRSGGVRNVMGAGYHYGRQAANGMSIGRSGAIATGRRLQIAG